MEKVNTAIYLTGSFGHSPPSINITAPIDEKVTGNKYITVVGECTDADGIATCSVDGIAVDPANIAKSIELNEGSNYIEIIATDTTGASSTAYRTVYRDISAPEIISGPTVSGSFGSGRRSISITFYDEYAGIHISNPTVRIKLPGSSHRRVVRLIPGVPSASPATARPWG